MTPDTPALWSIQTTTSPAIDVRTYIATAALQGLLSNPDKGYDPDGCAYDSIRFADALIAELGKEQPNT